MAKNKPNRPLNQSFQKGCARLRYTTFDNISTRGMESLCFRVVKSCPWITLNSEGKRCISRSPFKRLTKSGCNDRKRLRRPRVNLPVLTSLRFADPTAVVSEGYRQIAAMPELLG